MTKPTQETLREAVAVIVEQSLLRHGVQLSRQEGTLDDADAAIATMFEHLRTPSEKALRAGCNKIDWERNPQEHMPTAPNGIVDLNSTFLTPGATTIGQDMLDAWQAMLAAFQQENSDAANN